MSLYEEIERLRANGSPEDVARLLLRREGKYRERRYARLTKEEIQAFQRIRKDPVLRSLVKQERRTRVSFIQALDELRRLRNNDAIFRMAFLVKKPFYSDLVAGTNLPRGFTKFELSDDEREAVERLEIKVKPLVWRISARGYYETTNGLWELDYKGFEEYWLSYDGHLVGNWTFLRPDGRVRKNRRYVPFRSAREAKEFAANYELDEANG